jgi:hypothetical protein
MKRKICFTVITVLILASFGTAAIYIENPGFEEPDMGKIKGWETIPGWSSDTGAVDSGVEMDWTDYGVYSGFLMSGDPSVWQLTDAVINAGTEYVLSIEAQDNSTDTGTAKLGMIIYYDLEGYRVPIALGIYDLPPRVGDEHNWNTYSLVFNSSNAPSSVGNKIGIEFINFSAEGSWVGIDNVTLIPEPATLAMLALGGLGLMRRRT